MSVRKSRRLAKRTAGGDCAKLRDQTVWFYKRANGGVLSMKDRGPAGNELVMFVMIIALVIVLSLCKSCSSEWADIKNRLSNRETEATAG